MPESRGPLRKREPAEPVGQVRKMPRGEVFSLEKRKPTGPRAVVDNESGRVAPTIEE